jgi:hypothetical protein
VSSGVKCERAERERREGSSCCPLAGGLGNGEKKREIERDAK